MKNKIVGTFVCMLLIGAALSVSGTVLVRNNSNPLSKSNTLYVGGSGPGNYTKIQDAINDSSYGDTVFVYNGTYVENVEVGKSVSLIGEDKETTIIDGGFTGDVVNVSSDYVTISGFTVQNSKNGWESSGIILFSVRDSTITDNILTNNGIGIRILLSNFGYNNIMVNSASNNYIGILIDSSSHNNITGNNANLNVLIGISLAYDSNNNIIGCNNVSNNVFGITLYYSFYNNITGNNVNLNDAVGVDLYSSNYNTITGNNASSNNVIGILLESSSNNNHVFHNNLINNTQNAVDNYSNIWDDGKYGNYWSDYEEKYPNASKKLWKGIWDMPYEIPSKDNKDNYPLINQYPKSVIKSKSRDKTWNYNFPLLTWLLDRFPLLQRLLEWFIW